MAPGKAPAYPWYPGDFETDEAVKLMTYEEEGVYRRLLDHQWLHGGIPHDVDTIARLVPKIAPAKFRKLWRAMCDKFTDAGDGSPRLVNLKLEDIRRNRGAYLEHQRSAGEASAKARRERNGSAQPNRPTNQTSNDTRTDVRTGVRTDHRTGDTRLVATAPEVSFSSSISTDAVQNTASATTPNQTSNGLGPKAVGRFYLHRWQVEELIATLGPHADGFDLDVWLDQLTQKANADGITFPTRDGRWNWVRQQLAEEITRRKLPTAADPAKATSGPRSTVPGVAATAAKYLDPLPAAGVR